MSVTLLLAVVLDLRRGQAFIGTTPVLDREPFTAVMAAFGEPHYEGTARRLYLVDGFALVKEDVA